MVRKLQRSIPLVIALAALIVAQVACDDSGGGQTTIKETVSGDWIHVYFTNPRHPDDAPEDGDTQHNIGLDKQLAAVLGYAETSVDVVAYDFDLESVTNALIDAHQRGVKVRFVVESDNADEDAVGQLQQAGIPVVEDERDEGLMHNKFVVIDNQWVWLGSWNLTENGTYRNNNNAVLIASPSLAENYTAEFEEMFAGQFGPSSPANTPNPNIFITTESNGGQTQQVELKSYFSPEDEAQAQIIAEIQAAQNRIRFMAFIFTSDEIASAMIEQAQAGVVVQGVIEARNAEREYSDYERLRAKVHDVLPDGNPYIMHHKVIIIDDETVILGSYNFTASAEDRNDENVLIIHDPEVAALFVEEFGRVYKTARTAE